uniref:Uncharacterized protein n=1 Tax=Romanomermis culicivorax TaxID=13658 RepID=A0A915HTQ8_ROMCU
MEASIKTETIKALNTFKIQFVNKILVEDDNEAKANESTFDHMMEDFRTEIMLTRDDVNSERIQKRREMSSYEVFMKVLLICFYVTLDEIKVR